MRAGELYPGDDPELNRELDRRQAMLATLNAIPPERSDERAAAFEGLLAGIGAETFIRTPFYCDYGDGITIGARTFAYGNPARVAREIDERDRVEVPGER